MSRPALPFVEIGADLRFAVLKSMFSRGEVRGAGFMVTADELALCVKRDGTWSLTIGGDVPRNGRDLISLTEAYFSASRGDAAVRLLEAVSGLTLTAQQGGAIARAIET
jgi:hypothetical protein